MTLGNERKDQSEFLYHYRNLSDDLTHYSLYSLGQQSWEPEEKLFLPCLNHPTGCMWPLGHDVKSPPYMSSIDVTAKGDLSSVLGCCLSQNPTSLLKYGCTYILKIIWFPWPRTSGAPYEFLLWQNQSGTSLIITHENAEDNRSSEFESTDDLPGEEESRCVPRNMCQGHVCLALASKQHVSDIMQPADHHMSRHPIMGIVWELCWGSGF